MLFILYNWGFFLRVQIFATLFFGISISHHLNPIFLFFRWYEKTVSTLNTSPRPFRGMCIYQAHFPLCWTHWSTQAETPVSCSCEQKLTGQGMSQAIGSHSFWFELRKLGSCLFNHGIKRWCSLSSPCLYQWKQYTLKWNQDNRQMF